MRNTLRWIPLMAVVALMLGACASIGRPQGGPRDETPPQFVRSSPAPGQLGVNQRNFSLYFDENIKLDDAFNKVMVSPVQINAPKITSNGRKVSVELLDTLIPDVTYTIDFGDAIQDLNEGNVLDGFALDFSTGQAIDSLRISGLVLQAENLEPAQGFLVGAYSNLSDTAIRTLPPDRVARTNQYGQFTLRNLKAGKYRLYALNDVNRDRHWDRSEDVGFIDLLVEPYVKEISVTDTLYDSGRQDSLITRRGVQYLPNDVLITWFNENYQAQYIKDYKRPTRRQASLIFGAPNDSLPLITIASGVADTLKGTDISRWGVEIRSQRADSIDIWFTDPGVLAADSLTLAVKYQKPDSLDRLVWNTDTLKYYYREPKRSKKEIEADTLPKPLDVLGVSTLSGSMQEVYAPLRLNFSQPLARIDTAGIAFEMLVDTLWVPKPFTLEPDSLNPVLQRVIRQDWEPSAQYRLQIDSAAISSVYGEHNKRVSLEFRVKALEDYSNLTFKLENADSTAVVVLLNNSDVPVYTSRVRDGKAVFKYLTPGSYFARMFFDTDGNGKWSTGLLDSIQPEETAYYPKKIDLKKNWDVELSWDIYAEALDRQKPFAILKNKPKLQRGEKDPRQDQDGDEDEEDDWINGNRRRPGSNRREQNNNQMNLGGLKGGFQQTKGY